MTELRNGTIEAVGGAIEETQDPLTPSAEFSYVADHSRHGDINAYLGSILGPRFAAYRELWDRAHRMEIETEFPLFLALETQLRCNYRCTMCTYSEPEALREVRYSEVMSRELSDRIIAEAARHGCPSMNFNVLNEPLMDPLIIERIRGAHEAGIIDLRMNTNASLLDEEKAEALIDAGLTRLYVGMDAATASTYDQVRIGGDFDRVVENVERFLDIRERKGSLLPILRLSFVRLAGNEHEVQDYIDMWKGRADLVTVQEYMPPVHNEGFLAKHAVSKIVPDDYSCPQPFERMVIKGNGDVHPCCAQYNYKIKIGNVGESSIHELWNSADMKDLRRHMREGTWRQLDVCRACLESAYLHSK